MPVMKDSDLVFVYSTFPDDASARRVADALVRGRLAACVNIHGPMTSIYEWEGKLESGIEYAAFIKTRRALVDQAVAAARPLHPYTVPCFLVLPVEGGNADYLAWVQSQIKSV